MKFPKKRAMIGIFAIGAFLVTSADSCMGDNPDTANPPSMCSYVIGDGQDGRNATIHKVVYPNQSVDYNNDKEDVRYIPCNERNFIVNPEGEKNSSGKPVGDWHIPMNGKTTTGTPVQSWLRAYWTPNEDKEAMESFYILCDKYKCASDKAVSGDENFSTEGWNGLLGETFPTALEESFNDAVNTMGDVIWQKPTQAMYDEVAKKMAADFPIRVRAKTGRNLDLFCGSGNSGWPNSDKPGEGKYTCSNVRIEINSIFGANQDLRDSADALTQAEKEKDVNNQRLAAAQILYGPNTAYWLGLLDAIRACNEKTTCVVNIGGGTGNSAPVIAVPTK